VIRKAIPLVAVLATALACSTADLTGPPPAQSGPGTCGNAAQILCDAGAPGAGCTGAPRTAPGPGATVYPIGCRAYFTAQDCSTESTCSCDPGDGGGQWICN
jgi:hypothetical protein